MGPRISRYLQRQSLLQRDAENDYRTDAFGSYALTPFDYSADATTGLPSKAPM
jgi:hypothetical protein